jgi:hypothetical protein
MKLTKQGVRDLGFSKAKPRYLPEQCDHKRLKWCCYINSKPCGHIDCPDCGLYLDLGFELRGKWIW